MEIIPAASSFVCNANNYSQTFTASLGYDEGLRIVVVFSSRLLFKPLIVRAMTC